MEPISEQKSIPFTKTRYDVLDIGRYMLHKFALTADSEAGKSTATSSHPPPSTNGRGRKTEHMISELERISEPKSMPFTKLLYGVRDIGRYMLHTLALTVGSEAGKPTVTRSHPPRSNNGRG